MARTQGRQRQRFGPLTIDIYARISRAEDGSTFKVDDQVGVLETLIAERDGVVGKVHRDNNLSGWNPRVVRPSWDSMMARLRSGDADGVAVVVVDRFTRKMREGLDLIDIAKDRGAVIWSDGGSYDLNSADRQLGLPRRMQPSRDRVGEDRGEDHARQAAQGDARQVQRHSPWLRHPGLPADWSRLGAG